MLQKSTGILEELEVGPSIGRANSQLESPELSKLLMFVDFGPSQQSAPGSSEVGRTHPNGAQLQRTALSILNSRLGFESCLVISWSLVTSQ